MTENEKLYARVVSRVDREDTLIERRLGWMLTTQGLLFAALALLNPTEAHPILAQWLAVAVPLIGLLMALSTGFTIRLAHDELERLQSEWDSDVEGGAIKYPDPVGKKGKATFLGPSLGLPLLFSLAWISLIAYGLLCHFSRLQCGDGLQNIPC